MLRRRLQNERRRGEMPRGCDPYCSRATRRSAGRRSSPRGLRVLRVRVHGLASPAARRRAGLPPSSHRRRRQTRPHLFTRFRLRAVFEQRGLPALCWEFRGICDRNFRPACQRAFYDVDDPRRTVHGEPPPAAAPRTRRRVDAVRLRAPEGPARPSRPGRDTPRARGRAPSLAAPDARAASLAIFAAATVETNARRSPAQVQDRAGHADFACGNQISGTPRHRRDVVPATASARGTSRRSAHLTHA